jgi:hypothetical protein
MPFLSGPRARAKRVMKALPSAVQKRLESQNAANADELVETMKGFINDKTGKLASTVKREAAPEKSPIAQRVSAGGAATTKAVRKSKKGNAPLYDYANANEYGTEDMAAQPFFWPAWRLKRRRFKARMSRAGKKGIQEAVSK